MVILMPLYDGQINITMHGVLTRTIEARGLSLIHVIIVGCQLWAPKCAGTTFTEDVKALSVIQGIKN